MTLTLDYKTDKVGQFMGLYMIEKGTYENMETRQKTTQRNIVEIVETSREYVRQVLGGIPPTPKGEHRGKRTVE